MSQSTSSPTKAGVTVEGVNVEVLRTQLGRARGLGAARTGTAVWWTERVTSVALVPLTLWFVYVALHLAGRPRQGVAHFVGHPLNAALLLALVVITFQHMAMGLQVVIEDYIHIERIKMPALLAVKGAAGFMALACAVSVLKLALAG